MVLCTQLRAISHSEIRNSHYPGEGTWGKLPIYVVLTLFDLIYLSTESGNLTVTIFLNWYAQANARVA